MKTKILALAAFLLLATLCAQGYTTSGNTYTTTGAQADVQAAVNAAPDNGTVTIVIPNGTYSWTGKLTINRALNLAGASATGVTINDNYTGGFMISATSSANGNLNIYWLNIQTTSQVPSGTSYGSLGCDRTEPSNYTVLVHDCTIDSRANWAFPVIFKDNGIVMWNCNFPNTGSGQTSLTGIDLSCEKYGFTGSWNTPDSWGTQDTTGLANSYVENCTFGNGTSSNCNAEDGSRMVWRYNTMTDGCVSSHGWDTGSCGVRSMEVYNNTFLKGGLVNNCWVSINGGSGIVFNNAMPDTGRAGVQLNDANIRRKVGPPMVCQTSYPSAKQVGRGWSASSSTPYGHPAITQGGIGDTSEPVYVWSNSGTMTGSASYVKANQYEPDECGNGQSIGTYVQKDRDYFIGTAKPGYTPYPYPHPLHTAYAVGGGPTPAPTPTPVPTATPVPTPTPAPTPTPTPPTGAGFFQGNFSDSGTGTGSVTVAFTQPQFGGSYNVVAINSGTGVTAVTDSVGNKYTLVSGPTSSAGSFVALYTAPVTRSGPNSVSVAFAGASWNEVLIGEYAGITGVDATAVNSGSGSSPSSGNATTTVPGDIIVCYVKMAGDGSPAPGSGFTKQITPQWNSGLEDKVAPNAGSYAGTWNEPQAANWVCPMVALKTLSSVPTPTPGPSVTPSPTPTPIHTFEKWIEDQNNWIRAHPPTPDQ